MPNTKSVQSFRQALCLALCIGFTLTFRASVPAATTLDKVASRAGTLQGAAGYTSTGGGHTGTAGDYGMDLTLNNGWVSADGSFMNVAGANNTASIAFWAKNRLPGSTDCNSAFQVLSASASRGLEAHVPCDGTIYFDTSSCCGSPYRLSADISTFPDYTGDAWWTSSWHFWVFTYDNGNKQVWIDGKLFLEGSGFASLLTDLTTLNMGNGNGGAFHATVDDYSFYSTGLTEDSITNLYHGVLPTALSPSVGLMAYWDFNDFPPNGVFVSVSPTPSTVSAAPNLVRIVHIDGATPWTSGNVSLQIDGALVSSTFGKVNDQATVSYVPSPLFVSGSTHTATLTYPGTNGPSTTLQWTFTVGPYVKDVVSSRVGVLSGNATQTSSGGGHTGAGGDYGLDLPNSGGWVAIDATFLNAASANDEISLAFWLKNRIPGSNDCNSAFQVVSPSAAQQRGMEAHVPCDTDVYYDTSGYPGGDRLVKSITLFSGWTGSDAWWTGSWHFWVFSKKANVKEIWIDGILFAQATAAGPLFTDFTTLLFGTGHVPYSGLVDDLSIYSKALPQTNINALYTGTLPTGLPGSAGLMAWWDFNDIPINGVFQTVLPAPNSTNAAPDLVKVVHIDGASPWTSGNVSLKIDNVLVASSFSKVADSATVTFVPNPIFASGSTHTAALTYPGTNGPTTTLQWQFTVRTYGLITKDVVASRIGFLDGASSFTATNGGHTGAAGDFGLDFATAGGWVTIDGSFLNAASANDEITLAFWAKNRLPGSTDCNSAFWIYSASATDGNQYRGMEAHVPCDNDVYYDTSGYIGATKRISAPISSFPGYTGNDGFWTNNWHFWVFSKKAGVKQIWIDGTLFAQGTGAVPLFTDLSTFLFGTGHAAPLSGLVDDLSLYSKALTGTDITSLYTGTLPTALPGTAGLMAWWNFNDAPPSLSIVREGAQLKITYEGTLESTSTLGGTWAPVSGATSPYFVSPAGSAFYRAKR